jgi:hypothetical protein
MQRTLAVLGSRHGKTAEIVVSHASAEKQAGAAGHAKPASAPERAPFVARSRQASVAAATQPPGLRAAAPTINVTIGRIEVRAAPAPSTAVRAARPDPAKPSLADYLRSRNGGNT